MNLPPHPSLLRHRFTRAEPASAKPASLLDLNGPWRAAGPWHATRRGCSDPPGPLNARRRPHPAKTLGLVWRPLWQRGDELLSVLPLDQESQKWRETEHTELDCVKSRFATAEEIAVCPPIAAALRPGDRVLHYEYWELDAVRRLGPLYELAQQPREFTRLMELQQATLLMEGRTGLVLLRDWQCVLRVCTDVVPVEEPF